MNDPAARRHPLHVTGGDGAAVPHAVAVLHRSGQDVGNGLDSAVRMPRKASQIILRNIIAEIVEQQERIEVAGVSEAERAAQMHACAFESRFRLNEPFNRSNGHIKPSFFQSLMSGKPSRTRKRMRSRPRFVGQESSH